MLVRLFLPAENNVPDTAVPASVAAPQLSVAVGALWIPTAASFVGLTIKNKLRGQFVNVGKVLLQVIQVVVGNIFITLNLNRHSALLPEISFVTIYHFRRYHFSTKQVLL